jgi:hypothetical protein
MEESALLALSALERRRVLARLSSEKRQERRSRAVPNKIDALLTPQAAALVRARVLEERARKEALAQVRPTWNSAEVGHDAAERLGRQRDEFRHKLPIDVASQGVDTAREQLAAALSSMRARVAAFEREAERRLSCTLSMLTEEFTQRCVALEDLYLGETLRRKTEEVLELLTAAKAA